MSWWTYVIRTSGTESPKAMAKQTGIDGPNFSKWKTGQVPRPQFVAAFARAYGVPVLEAFVAAGFLTPEEAGERPAAAPSLGSLSDDELVDEIRERLRAGERDVDRDAPAMTIAARTTGQGTTRERQAAEAMRRERLRRSESGDDGGGTDAPDIEVS